MLKVAPPAGEFFLDEKDDGPVVLLSGGVGLTPMMSMLETIVQSGSGRPVWYIHGAREWPRPRDGRARAGAGVPSPQRHGAHLLQRAGPKRRSSAATMTSVASSAPTGWPATRPCQEAAYYLCGPRPFLRAMVGGLARTGVPLSSIRYEFFGPADELLAA